jgi:hypothetical protein
VVSAGAVLSGRFELRRTLGAEGDATVWDAFDRTLDRRVLIKLLRDDLAGQPEAIERFHREMRAAARSEVTSGPRVLDAGDDPVTSMPFMVFEWLEPEPAADVTPTARHLPTQERRSPSPERRSPSPDRHVTPPEPHLPPPDRHSPTPDRHVTPSDRHSPPPEPHLPPAEQARRVTPSSEQAQRVTSPAEQTRRVTPPAAQRQVKPVQRQRVRVAPGGSPMRGGGGTNRALQTLVLLLVLVPLAIGAFIIRGFLDQPTAVTSTAFNASSGPIAPTPVTVASPTPASRQAAAAPPPPAQAAPTRQPTAAVAAVPAAAAARPAPSSVAAGAGERRRVANTDGQGVALRATPGGDKLPAKGDDEGATVTRWETRGMWAHIRGDDGREGWVLAVTLVP